MIPCQWLQLFNQSLSSTTHFTRFMTILLFNFHIRFAAMVWFYDLDQQSIQCFCRNIIQIQMIQPPNFWIFLNNKLQLFIVSFISIHMESIQCSFNKKCYLICTQKSCVSNPFLCHQDTCQCYSLHNSCFVNIRMKTLKETIENKIKNKTQSIQNYISFISDLYKENIKQIQRSYNEFKTRSKVFGLSALQLQFLNKVKQSKTKELTSSYMEKLSYQLKAESIIEFPDIKILKKQFNDLTEKLLKILEIDPIVKKLIFASKITKDIPTLLSFFEPKKIANFRLLYRASENAFSTSKFHQLCDDIPNTLVIAKTQFEKIIGGYTPLLWKKNSNQKQQDNKKESFLFSLSLKTKIPLVNSIQSIINQAGYGPIFGTFHNNFSCFYIIDKANKSNKNRIEISPFGPYYHQDYKNDQESDFKLSGQALGSNFKVVQWEVFQVET